MASSVDHSISDEGGVVIEIRRRNFLATNMHLICFAYIGASVVAGELFLLIVALCASAAHTYAARHNLFPATPAGIAFTQGCVIVDGVRYRRTEADAIVVACSFGQEMLNSGTLSVRIPSGPTVVIPDIHDATAILDIPGATYASLWSGVMVAGPRI